MEELGDALANVTVTAVAAANKDTHVLPIHSPTFIGLPAELRLEIYNIVEALQPRGHRGWRVADCVAVFRDRSAINTPDLAALARTCRLVNGEVHDMLYDQAFQIEFATTFSQKTTIPMELPTHTGLDFLRYATGVHLQMDLTYRPGGAFASEFPRPGCTVLEFRTLKNIIDALDNSPALRSFSFDPLATGRGSSDPAYGYEGFKDTLESLHSGNTKSGARDGKSHKERELDYSQVVLLVCKLLLGSRCGGDDDEFFKLIAGSTTTFFPLAGLVEGYQESEYFNAVNVKHHISPPPPLLLETIRSTKDTQEARNQHDSLTATTKPDIPPSLLVATNIMASSSTATDNGAADANNKTSQTDDPPLLKIPPEVRLNTHEQVEALQQLTRPNNRSGFQAINDYVVMNRFCCRRSAFDALLALSLTCHSTNTEIHGLLYGRTFQLRVTDRKFDHLTMPSGLPPNAGLKFLHHVKYLHVDFEISTRQSPRSVAHHLHCLESVIIALRTSTALRTISFGVLAGTIDQRATFAFKHILLDLRRTIMRNGVKGTTMKERQLDYAQSVADTIKRMLFQHKGDEERFFDYLAKLEEDVQ
ncbi:uncharacterized protein LTR77_000828 [Saxophila tyrrhenica]|uniref:F-box domain-containing protein n=1 Tax=Saxophila tyrrhenica TaxID=1690608 RepID=A0AAV9PRN6_9PEZI|nr:hypothetical protein LTR77_000828 [Saxophila tyrrhenica]